MVPNMGNFPKNHGLLGVFDIKLGGSAAKPKSWVSFSICRFSNSAVSESTGVSLSDCNFPVSGFDLLGFFAIEAAASVTRANARREPSIISWLHPQTANLLTEESSESYMLVIASYDQWVIARIRQEMESWRLFLSARMLEWRRAQGCSRSVTKILGAVEHFYFGQCSASTITRQ